MQEQLKKVGLNPRIVQTTNIAQDLYIAKKAPSNILSTINPGVAKLNNLTPKFCHDAFSLLREQVQAQLPAENYELLRPYLDRNVDVLSDFAEPLTPAEPARAPCLRGGACRPWQVASAPP